MGKKRHSQDKLWITNKELVQDWGGKKEDEPKGAPIKRLPFFCCSLSFMPFQDPVCLKDGTIFDIVNILPYLKKFKKNPVNGKPLKSSDLIKLNFYKNQDDEYHCPVTYKVFTENSIIIAIKETGNVYSYEAFDELNKKPKNFKDLLNNQPFDPANIIVIQDPNENRNRNILDFYFIQNKEDVDFIRLGEDVTLEDFMKKKENFVNIPARYKELLDTYDDKPENIRKADIIKMINNNQSITDEDDRIKNIKKEYKTFSDTLKIIEKEMQDCELTDQKKFREFFMIPTNIYIYHLKQQNDNNLLHKKYTDGKASISFTSTSFDPVNNNKLRNLTDDELRMRFYSIVKSRQSKGYAKIITNHGALNILIHADLVPKTAENFLELCQSGYYNNTIFHRLVKNFCIQGGDPTGTGMGGSSIFGKPFQDEFNKSLLHKSRGVLSMANSGNNTNQSQFFITFKATPHLDEVHSVFGEVVGNLKLLDDLEAIGSDQNNKPKKEIKILTVEVYSNPFREVISELLLKEFSEKIMKEILNEQINIDLITNEDDINRLGYNNALKKKTNEVENLSDIGKYLGKKRNNTDIARMNKTDPYLFDKPKNKKVGQFNFSNW